MVVSEWDQRQLCPDGGCIGVIGPEGTCKVCGRAAPNWGDERMRGLLESEDLAEDAGEDSADDHAADPAVSERVAHEPREPVDDAEAARGPAPWTERQLCSDGACIGVIGPDGRCHVCGRSAVAPTPGSGAVRAAPASDAPAAGAMAGDPAPETGPEAAPETGPEAAPEAAPDQPARCPEAGCTGTLGEDGRCTVCGKGAS